ncbi:response regulator [bacterium]|nr:response regulator [bacterium]
MPNEKILIIDDEVDNLYLLQMRLQASEFIVVTASEPAKGIEVAINEKPDLILLDVKMPQMSGFEVCRKLKNTLSTARIPVIFLTCQDDVTHKIKGLEDGADDYLIKDEIDYREIAARIRSVLRRTQANISMNPLTHLPGNKLIEAEINKRLQNGFNFTVGYVDIDNFKAYNDVYGFKSGDNVILLLAETMNDAVNSKGDSSDFVGHIGGDDFVFITTDRNYESISRQIIDRFALKIPGLYSEEHLREGGFRSVNREGVEQFFPLISVTIANIPGANRLESPEDIALQASKLKSKLKNEGGNRYGTLNIAAYENS